jgi:hypothetical protein
MAHLSPSRFPQRQEHRVGHEEARRVDFWGPPKGEAEVHTKEPPVAA